MKRISIPLLLALATGLFLAGCSNEGDPIPTSGPTGLLTWNPAADEPPTYYNCSAKCLEEYSDCLTAADQNFSACMAKATTAPAVDICNDQHRASVRGCGQAHFACLSRCPSAPPTPTIPPNIPGLDDPDDGGGGVEVELNEENSP